MYIGHMLESEPIAMSDFDTLAAPRVARRHLESIKEPRRRQILQNFIEHAEAEASGRYTDLMATCSLKRQQYATFGSEFGAPQSYEELAAHYHGLIASNIYLIHFAIEKLAVGEDVLFVEGIVHQLYPGELLKPIFGLEVEDDSAVYQLTKRTALTFLFDADGLGAGEQAYSDGPTTLDDLVKVAPEEVPEAFYKNPLTVA
jgi:hypothetical protein